MNLKMKLKSTIKKSVMSIYCRRFLAPITFREIPPDSIKVKCDVSESRILTGTSNNVFVISANGRTCYFRECRKHTAAREYVKQLIADYYDEICPEDRADRETVEAIFKDGKAFRRFFNMGVVNDPTSTVAHFFETEDAALLGIHSKSAEQTERLKRFIQFAWGDLYSYHLNAGIRTGTYQTYNAVRELETKRIADLVGLGDLIPEVRYGILCINGRRTRFGTFMEAAPGVCMSRMPAESRSNVISPALQHSLSNLNLLDVLCCERDHRPCNYNVLLREGKAVAVCAFDNDAPMSFSRPDISFATYMQCVPWARGDRLCRPYLDKALAERVLAIDEKALLHNSYLNPFQQKMLVKRTRAVRRVLEKTVQQHPEALLQAHEWSQETVNEERKPVYGKTYLSLFAEDYTLLDQPWVREEDLR